MSTSGRTMRTVAGLASLALLALGLAGCAKQAPEIPGSEPQLRLLSEAQYRAVIADLFGETITVGGSFDPLVRTNGLMTVGASKAHITPAGLEQFDLMARSIAAQVMSEEHRDAFVPCRPQSATAADDACATQFFTQTGRLLFRRALTSAEIDVPVALARGIAQSRSSFYEGLQAGLAGMLVAPDFLFIIDRTESDPEAKGKLRLDGYSKAARLSFFLWGSTPDDALLTAAEKGELHQRRGLEQQVERMTGSPKLETGLRSFFNDMLALQDLPKLQKDSVIYPTFSADVAADAREQTLRTIVDHLVTQNGDYRDVFTTRRTFMSGPLGRIYRVPVERPDGGWTPYEFPEGDPRAGLITQASIAAMYAHPGRSSPTLRGRAIRELMLCQKIPDPPGDVDFSLFNDPNSPNRTARDRLTAHSTVPACAGCHKLTDPIGLALEKIDGAGQMRDTESGAPIDTSGDLDGKAFTDASGLGKAIRDNPAAPACVVNRLYSYAVARTPGREEKALLTFYDEQFAASGYRVPELLQTIANSGALFAVKAPKPQAPAPQTAAAEARDDKGERS